MLNSVYNFIRERALTGVKPDFDAEDIRRAAIINLFCVTGLIVTAVLATRALIDGDTGLSYSLYIVSVVYAFIHISMQTLNSRRNQHRIAAFLISTLMALMGYLIVYGGKSGTGPIWILILPPVTLFLNGLRRGLAILLSFIAIVIVLFFIVDETVLQYSYSLAIKQRIVYVYLTMTVLSSFYEYSREKTYHDIKALKRQFEKKATHDDLTQLLNRRGMLERIDTEIARATRHNSDISILLLDIDRFKALNDEYGHDAGDKALIHIAASLKSSIRGQDYVCRWGGEEFLLVLPETDKHLAATLAEKVRQNIEQLSFQYKKHQISLTASLGVAEVNRLTTFEKAISQADKAMYCAKQNGRNQISIHPD